MTAMADRAPDAPGATTDATDGVESALPSVGARVLAFGSILVAGICGGLIGFAFIDLQCTDDCGSAPAVGALVGAVLSAVGVAVVAVLALRAMGEWQTVQARDRAAAEREAKRSTC